MMKEEAVEKPRRSDPYIWGIIIILYIVSVVEVYSAISREITGGDVYSPIIKHALLLFSGFLITYATSRVHYKWFKVMAYLMIPATIVLLVSILLWGDTLNGAKRTISVLGISLQGSEVAKVTIVLAMATVLAKSQIKRGVNTKGVVLVVVLVTIFSGLLFTQGLTNTLLFIGISVCMMLIGGVEWYKLGIIFLAYLVLALAVMQAKDILTESELFNKQAQTEQTAQAGEQVEQKKVLIQRSSTWKSRLEDFFDCHHHRRPGLCGRRGRALAGLPHDSGAGGAHCPAVHQSLPGPAGDGYGHDDCASGPLQHGYRGRGIPGFGPAAAAHQ